MVSRIYSNNINGIHSMRDDSNSMGNGNTKQQSFSNKYKDFDNVFNAGKIFIYLIQLISSIIN